MKNSPLQLLSYVVADISSTANSKFNPEKPLEMAFEQFIVDVKTNPLEPSKEFPGHHWSVEMSVTQKIKEGQNFPYEFRIVLVGMFVFLDGALEPEKEIQFVRVNGSSMLYAAAREQIRALTSAGPWGAIIIPTLSFYDKQPAAKEETPTKAP